MPTDINRRFLLASRPTDLPSDANFRIESKAMPTLEDGQVLVRVLIAALSPWQGQRLKDFENYTQPFEIGELIDCDVLGQVISGEADGLKRGDLVTGRLGWQEYAAAKPEYLSPATREFDETLWLTALSSPGLTAYSAMEMFGRPMPGQTIVVTSAAGSVGSYAIQLAKLAGMTVVGIAGGAEKCRVVSELLGADACLDHRMPDLASRLRETCPEGVHLFLDTVGGWIGDAARRACLSPRRDCPGQRRRRGGRFYDSVGCVARGHGRKRPSCPEARDREVSEGPCGAKCGRKTP